MAAPGDEASSASGSEAVELTITFHRTSDDSFHTASLRLPPNVRTISDVKLRIQTDFSIPICQQKLTSNGHVLADTQTTSQLYLRHQDTLTLTYYREADVKLLGEFLSESDGIKALVSKLQAQPELVSQQWDDTDEELQDLVSGCDNQFHYVTYRSLFPWESPQSEANRQFIVQERGMQAVLLLYTLLQGVPWEERSIQMQGLELSCVSLLWNFGETAYARKLVLDRGGLDLMTRSLMVYSDEEFLQKYRIHELFDGAVGALSNYSEVESCQLSLVQNTPVMKRLLHFAIHGAPLNFYTKMLIANCLFRLSHNLQTHSHLAQSELLGNILEFFFNYPQAYPPSELIRYCICQAVARVVLYSYSSIPEGLCGRVFTAVKNHQLSPPAHLTEMLAKFQYNWTTVVPLVEAVFVPLRGGARRGDGGKEGERGEEGKGGGQYPAEEQLRFAGVEVCVLGLMAEMGRQRNRQLALQQGLLDYIICLPWGVGDVELRKNLKSVVDAFRADHKALPVPRLSTVAKATLARADRAFSLELRKHL